ncbi:DUF2795 domain-containing protein [Pseudonocardia sp. KRD291]|uniref:DUF2795 domain-containing protein n=1 Tax=Pseudonocardia sp. KRD291 TaxID=2792007 RepID=UPI001C4A4D9E|nr:DUF2795 domain-containing protein [Pseudonocardia sp. KRD291]MBW0101657.1 DUF2795 domain-containing protein [Pseudonocardia sp. KRD291]
MTRRDDLRVDKALQGADFPADRRTLLTYAQERGADEETLEAMRALPERTYARASEVVDAVPQEPEGDRPGGVER